MLEGLGLGIVIFWIWVGAPWWERRKRAKATKAAAVAGPVRPEPFVQMVFGSGDVVHLTRDEVARLVRDISAREQ